jgi:cell division protein FtsI/penicillin-binding protein 2/cell division protein FtsW (lipid II flippase)
VYTPLFAGFGLFAILLAFGSGPAGSDSKVNLGPAQPVELIKILLAAFMAGYFTQKWERLRDLRERRLPAWLWWFEMPRLAHALPVMVAVACALAMFFLLKDLGPALVTGFLFLAMFGVARARSGLALAGVALIAGGITLGYRLGQPATVVNRISMWLSPWDNDARGGDQLAHSFWALATGGPLGSGPGRGDPALIPAGHTDLVLSAIGEEWGFLGIVLVCLLFVLLIHRTFRIALRAADEHAVFVGLALGMLAALEMIFISAGALGAIPLSGIVAPFLSSGNSAMLANFFMFAIVLGISNQPASAEIGKPFARPVRRLALVLCGLAAALVAKAAYVQVLHDREWLERDVRVFQADGVKRAQHNPRLNSLAQELTRGNIFDRNGVLVATSDYAELERRREEYRKLGVSIDAACSRGDNRHYPFGLSTAHLLGDWRTRENFHASNASLIEDDLNVKLQGFRDYHELAEVVRYRHRPGHPALERLRARDRTVRTPIDIRLQTRAAAAIKGTGALVVMDAATGDVLALVSSPANEIDRARYGQYPPGSTFKLVTALAALSLDRKLAAKTFHCGPLGGGRVGARIPGWNRPIRDDAGDPAHGSPNLARAITVSCNAYFAQLGVHAVGSEALGRMAAAFEVPAGELKRALPFASYGQGEVLSTPFKMARIVATIASGGVMPQGRWVAGEDNTRTAPPRQVVPGEAARHIAAAMRAVVTSGTARRPFAGLDVSVAGKTGTAQVNQGMPHSWFAGFAPYDGDGPRIAFAVVVEHGGYGSQAAAPIARALVEAARDLGIIQAR